MEAQGHVKLNYNQMTNDELINIIDNLMELGKIAHSKLLPMIQQTREECVKELEGRYIDEEYLKFLKK